MGSVLSSHSSPDFMPSVLALCLSGCLVRYYSRILSDFVSKLWADLQAGRRAQSTQAVPDSLAPSPGQVFRLDLIEAMSERLTVPEPRSCHYCARGTTYPMRGQLEAGRKVPRRCAGTHRQGGGGGLGHQDQPHALFGIGRVAQKAQPSASSTWSSSRAKSPASSSTARCATSIHDAPFRSAWPCLWHQTSSLIVPKTQWGHSSGPASTSRPPTSKSSSWPPPLRPPGHTVPLQALPFRRPLLRLLVAAFRRAADASSPRPSFVCPSPGLALRR